MKRAAICSLLVSLVAACSIRGQSKLSAKWEELTAAEFRDAIQLSKGTCLLPFGILEKHGPHLPLGTDLLNVRHASLQAAQQEYALVFPQYYFGQIFEAKHEPGTVAYSMELQLRLLQETTDEMARNGCKKIVIVNGHGGNKKSTGIDYHAGENETSNTMASRPDLVHLDRAASESGGDQKRVNLPEGVYTGIWWYARFPNHYSGDGSVATRELGEWNMNNWIAATVEAIRAAKADDQSLKLQNEFYEKSKHPLDTRP